MSDTSHDPNQMTGAAMIVRALIDHGVKHIFGYPGGAVLPICLLYTSPSPRD